MSKHDNTSLVWHPRKGAALMAHVVDISDMVVSDHRDDILVTYSLGSCIGLSLHDPVAGVGGLIHCMLPLSKIDARKAEHTPCMFVDTGVPLFLQKAFDLGARRRHLVAKVAGAARSLDEKGMFNIGERNYTVLRKILWKNSILIASESIGGAHPRTMRLYMNSGTTTVGLRGKEIEL